MKKAVFFDRDGVLNQLVKRNKGYFSPRKKSDFSIISNSIKVTKYTKLKGYLNIVISNQPDIMGGYLSKKELNDMTEILYNKLIIDDVFYCTHDDNICQCKKPLPGLIFQAQEKWNIDLNNSIMIGDTEKDYYAAKSSNLDFYLVNNSNNSHLKIKQRIEDIIEIINIINLKG